MGHRAGLLEQDFARAADGSVTLETSYPVIPKMMSPVRGRLPPPRFQLRSVFLQEPAPGGPRDALVKHPVY